jgi:hypothetical protein
MSEGVCTMCQNDGGYYAIKGFLYQFDKTIIEILRNKEDTIIYVEKIQDINYENYIMQIKHKEAANFTNSKVRDPIIQLLELYKKDTDKRFCLYGFFRDKKPSNIVFTKVDQLDEILKYRDDNKTKELQQKFPKELRKGFITSFTLCFGEDFENQFNYLLNEIKGSYQLGSDDDAIICHSLIREKLLELAIKPDENQRCITGRQLKQYVSSCKKKIFYGYYDSIMGREKYLKLVKRQYFTINSTNLNRFERLFVIDCRDIFDQTTLRKITESISNKYFKKGKSPAPYVCFRGIENEILTDLKRGMRDDEISFSDGTYFDGDRFRVKSLKEDGELNGVRVKMIDEGNIDVVTREVIFKEYYHLFLDKPLEFNSNYIEIKVQINNITEVNKLIS